MQDLSSFWVTLAVTSWFPSLVSSGTSEYTKQVTEGLHRCTTQTRHWEWKDEITRYNGSLDISCQGMHYKRDVFAYKLKNLNAIMVFAEPELYHTCKKALIFDGPLEGIFSRLIKCLNFENRMIFRCSSKRRGLCPTQKVSFASHRLLCRTWWRSLWMQKWRSKTCPYDHHYYHFLNVSEFQSSLKQRYKKLPSSYQSKLK